MLLNLISFTISLALLILSISLLFKNKEDRKYLYFAFIIFLEGLQRIIFSFYVFDILNSLNFSVVLFIVNAGILPATLYLGFKNHQSKTKFAKEDLLYLGTSIIFIIVLLAFEVSIEKSVFCILINTTLYFILAINYSLKTSLKHSTKPNIKKNFKSISFLVFLVFLVLSYIFILSAIKKPELWLRDFYNLTLFLWVPIAFYLNFKSKHLVSNRFEFKSYPEYKSIFHVWHLQSQKNIDQNDLPVKNNINYSESEMINSIKDLEKSKLKDLESIPTIKNISESINKPQSHLKYFIKYYCDYSFNEYVNILKIRKSLSLMNQGYLNTHTIESLSKECHFNSRITFFNNFKKIVGMNPTDYLKTKN